MTTLDEKVEVKEGAACIEKRSACMYQRQPQPRINSPQSRYRRERRRVKAQVFVYTALGISLWLGVLTYFSPRLTGSTWLGRKLLSSSKCHDFADWLEKGGFLLYFGAILYLFLGISIVCDEFFVGSLQAISTKLKLSEDVAGATFMAAGSSAPELFSSLVALTNDEAANDIGIGTIVGSAIFNILVIIGVTAIFSGRTLYLDYRPLIRDAIFYAASIACVIWFFHDGEIHWWEGLISVLLYGTYVLAMKYNSQIIDRFPKMEHQYSTNKVGASDVANSQKALVSPHLDSPRLDGNEIENGYGPSSSDRPPPVLSPNSSRRPSRIDRYRTFAETNGMADFAEKEEEYWWFVVPKPNGSMIAWLLSVPWYFAFGVTIPRCESERWKKWYLLTFFNAILWIGLISWFMVEWAGDIGCILGIPSAIMGVTVLAAGTSIPDALSSIVVARAGMGDMAVANAVGSNVFDIWLGLGIPWLFVIPFKYDGGGNDTMDRHIEVDNGELLPNVLILFGVLMFYLGSVLFSKWRLFPTEGYIFIALYGVYAIYNIVAVWLLDIYNSEDD